MGYEDDRDWCYGWVPLPLDHPNCTRYKEFDYTTAGELKSIVTGTFTLPKLDIHPLTT